MPANGSAASEILKLSVGMAQVWLELVLPALIGTGGLAGCRMCHVGGFHVPIRIKRAFIINKTQLF